MILDALEYDLPHHRHTPSVTAAPIASPLLAASAAADEAEGAQSTHTFKVVTMKRTLLLCAPSEEEEIKWLSAVRALIARRSGQGVVPGDTAAAALTPSSRGAAPIVPPVAEIPAAGVANIAPPGPVAGAGAGGGAAGVGGGAAGRRRDSTARRVSGAAGSVFAGAGPQESASERQS